ncbi:MAG: hypothetical protein JW793_14535 [Acidobacteria bacterium]|nr:hypothetical protein [Acidobacteriota bacterium]
MSRSGIGNLARDPNASDSGMWMFCFGFGLSGMPQGNSLDYEGISTEDLADQYWISDAAELSPGRCGNFGALICAGKYLQEAMHAISDNPGTVAVCERPSRIGGKYG